MTWYWWTVLYFGIGTVIGVIGYITVIKGIFGDSSSYADTRSMAAIFTSVLSFLFWPLCIMFTPVLLGKMFVSAPSYIKRKKSDYKQGQKLKAENKELKERLKHMEGALSEVEEEA